MNIVAIILFVLQWVSLYGSYTSYCAAWHIRNLSFFVYLFAMPFEFGFAYFVGQLFPTILGIICLIIHGKIKRRKYTTYYCETCKDVIGQAKGKKCLCLTCRQPRKELPVRFREWDALSEDEQNGFINGQ